MAKRIYITKGKGHSEKTGKDYVFYELHAGHYSHRFFALSELESYYLDKFITEEAQEAFKSGSEDDDRLDPEEELEKGLDEVRFR